MSDEVSPLPRDKRGRRIRPKREVTGAPGLIWRRLRGRNDNWQEMVKAGMTPDSGSQTGKLFLFGVITGTQASALRLAAEVTGEYDRFHNSPGLKRTVASPSYTRGSRGEDDELNRRIAAGTIDQYTRMANRAKKSWLKLQGCFPTEEARIMVERIAVDEVEIDSCHHRDLVVVLNRIISRFGL